MYVDGANPEVIRELKRRIGEFENIQEYYTEDQIWQMRYGDNMQIIPVNSRKRHREMLQWTYIRKRSATFKMVELRYEFDSMLTDLADTVDCTFNLSKSRFELDRTLVS